MEKTKVCIWLDSDLHAYLNGARGEELTIPQYIRLILKQKMKSANKRKPKSVASDPFSYYIISPEVIPDDLKEYADLLIEWWPIRKKKVHRVLQALLTASLKHLVISITR